MSIESYLQINQMYSLKNQSQNILILYFCFKSWTLYSWMIYFLNLKLIDFLYTKYVNNIFKTKVTIELVYDLYLRTCRYFNQIYKFLGFQRHYFS